MGKVVAKQMVNYIKFEKRIVPWVTRWTGEVFIPLITSGLKGLEYVNGTVLDRDSFGALWWTDRQNCRTGEPQFREVNCMRQKNAMLSGICQVCGESAIGFDGTWWLFPKGEWKEMKEFSAVPGKVVVTATPPTCRRCWRLATALCPHLREGAVAAVGVSPRPWGVIGDAYVAGKVQKGSRVKFGDPLMSWVVAKQMVVVGRWESADGKEVVENGRI